MRAFRLLLGAISIVIALSLWAAPKGVSAAEVRSGESPEVPTSQTVNDDLYITGGTVKIAGRVNGDVVAAAGKIEISGQIGGSLQVLAGQVEITGDVTGAVRSLAGDVTISGDVGRDVVLAGGTLTLKNNGTIGGDVIVAGGDIELLGAVNGEVKGNVGTLAINNRVGGNVDVTADEVRLLSKARIGGDFRYASRNEASVALGAAVTGATVRTEPERFYPGDNAAAWLSSGLFRIFCGLIAGLAVILLLPRSVASVADAARAAPLTSFLLGLLLIVLLPVFFTILLVTVVGIPVGLVGFAIFFSVLYLSQVFLGLAMGRVILPSRWDTSSRGYNLLAMVIGVLIIGGMRLIPVPFLGGIIALVTAVLGLGAFALAIRSARRPAKLPAY